MGAREQRKRMRLAAVADIHCSKTGTPAMQSLFAPVNDIADILVLAGDLTDYGLPEEAQILAKELTSLVRIPIVAVLGNHDFEAGKQQEITQILCDAGVHLLDGDACEIAGIGFAGIKGFAGGFGRDALGAWGEEIIKQFVHEALNEALKLESALARLRTQQRIAVLHYAPIRATVEGEPAEVFPFLGSSRLEEPLMRYPITAVFHGHAHQGSPDGQLAAGAPVYNVALPIMRRTFPNRPPFRVLELAIDQQ
jgi:Icc-related predicted phosphoesterase